MTTMKQQIIDMYQSRITKGEIKSMVTENTLKKHMGNISILERTLGTGCEDINDMNWCEKSFEELNEAIKNLKNKTGGTASLATQHSYISTLIILIRCRCPEDYYEKEQFKDAMKYIHKDGEFMKSLKEYKSGARHRSAMTDTQKENIINIIDGYLADKNGDLDMKLILSIYKNHPFRLEVADLIYLEPRQYNMLKNRKALSGNYVVKSKGISNRGKLFFSFNDYKTFDRYGTREIQITDKTLKTLMMEKLLPMAPNTFNSKLFNLNRNQLTKKVIGFFEKRGLKKITPTVLTKLILNDEFLTPEAQEVISKQKKLANERGHSVSTQQNAYVSGV